MQSFAELSLSAPLNRAIAEVGYEKPSPIQAQALPILLAEPTDFLGLAATGTGKTAAFSIPMLEKLDPKLRSVQTLILCPTRELALQVSGQIDLLGKYKGVRSLAIYGGAGYGDQIRGIRDGAQVVVGTPGRLIDHLEKGTLRLDDVKTVILDEADEMISMGFKEDLEKILESVPKETSNIWLFSATMSPEVRRVADEYLRSPKQIQVNRTEMLPSTVKQLYYMTHESDKPEILSKLIDAAEDFYGLIFCQTKALVVDLTAYLTERGIRVDNLHGDKSQDAREKTLQMFRDRKVTILVCTDVAARGIDVKDITHVINYSLPRELDNYVHRIGRTGRSGKSGIAMSLVTHSHRRLLYAIERMTKVRLEEGVIPSRREIGSKKVGKLLEKFQGQPNFQRAVEVMGENWKEAIAQMTPEEIAGRFLALLVPDVFSNDVRPQLPKRAPKPREFGSNDFDRSKRPGRDGDRRPFAPKRGGGKFDRPERFGGNDRPAERFGGGDRPPRFGGNDRPARFGGNDRPERFGGGDRPERNDRAERPAFGDRKPFDRDGANNKPFDRSARPPRKRPATGEGYFEKKAAAANRGHFSARIED